MPSIRDLMTYICTDYGDQQLSGREWLQTSKPSLTHYTEDQGTWWEDFRVTTQPNKTVSAYYNSPIMAGLPPSQWETSLQSNAISHWLGAHLESDLLHANSDLHLTSPPPGLNNCNLHTFSYICSSQMRTQRGFRWYFYQISQMKYQWKYYWNVSMGLMNGHSAY